MRGPRIRAAVGRLEDRQVPVHLVAVLVGGLVGLAAPGAGRAFETLIYPVLGALLYVTFLQVPFTALRRAFADRRFLAAVLGLNFVVVPVVAFGLSRLAPGGTVVELGVLMVLLTPCIDYVVVFTRLAGGSDRRLLAAAPLLMLAQTLLLPAYLWLFLGPGLAEVVRPGPFVEAFLLLIALPLALAWATERWAARSAVGGRVKGIADLTPVVLMALTLLVVVASQVPRVRDDAGRVIGVVPLYVAFLVVMVGVGVVLARRLRLDAPAGRALMFSGATRNSLVVLPLALALGDEYALTGAVVVTQTLVEVLGMVALVRLAPRLLPAASALSRPGGRTRRRPGRGRPVR
ncbi:arsenic resistance protein [Patulibacter sp.]|uniref:arsenic resistance protein n=1 Tax=Patulibacter sp. TaxID=1912859 RepID=UPI002721173D|nr:bile acid:sodium symporter [Patulibacter sp.]MDO9407336.1 bile acid:sodium symporter [Patulibacter sp.]